MVFGYTEKDVERFLAAKDQVIATLNGQITFLGIEVNRERQRAELAVDRLLELQKIPSVMPERVRVPTKEEREEASKRIKEMELVRSQLEKIGDIGSDPNLEPGKVHEMQ